MQGMWWKTITRSPAAYLLTSPPGCRHHARRLMPKNAGRSQQIVFDLLQIGVADAARLHAHQDFPWADARGRNGLHRTMLPPVYTAACIIRPELRSASADSELAVGNESLPVPLRGIAASPVELHQFGNQREGMAKGMRRYPRPAETADCCRASD